MSCDGLHDSFFGNRRLCQLINFSAISQYYDPLALPYYFLQFRADEENRQTFLTERLNQLFDFCFRSHIDSACRLVQNKELRLDSQPPGEQNFLLVPAAEIAHNLLAIRGFDPERLDKAIRQLFLFGDRQSSPTAATCLQR